MYALPGQAVAGAIADIDAAAALGPTHISWYHLTLEPNTVFFSRPPAGIPGDEMAAKILDAGEARLAGSGYERYEVSAYTKGGRQCRHNINYWSFGDYLAVGAGAHGKFSAGGAVERYRKPANPQQYMKCMETGTGLETATTLSADELLFEFMLNALRLTAGFEERLFTDRTGLPRALLRSRLGPLRERGLIDDAGGQSWRPTPVGQRFLNDLQAHFLPD